jgi:hypothetical protein
MDLVIHRVSHFTLKLGRNTYICTSPGSILKLGCYVLLEWAFSGSKNFVVSLQKTVVQNNYFSDKNYYRMYCLFKTTVFFFCSNF